MIFETGAFYHKNTGKTRGSDIFHKKHMIDRTKELQQSNVASPRERLNEWESLRQVNAENDIEMGKMNDKWMNTFFEDVRTTILESVICR